MFALGIRYLNDWAMAWHPSYRDPGRERAEWPPHPDRVFMAMAAAHFETDGPAEERAALEWLESQGEPELFAGGCSRREVVASFAPVNDDSTPWNEQKKKPYQPIQDLGIGRNRQARPFPVAVPDEPVMFQIWRDAAPTTEQVRVLTSLCTKVTSIGHSASLVQMWVEDSPPAANLSPCDDLAVDDRMRVTYRGRIAELERAFNRTAIEEFSAIERELQTAKGSRKTELKKIRKEEFGDRPPSTLRPVPRSWKGYRAKTEPGPTIQPACSVFDANLLVFRRTAGPRLGLESTLQLTAAVRDTVMSVCGLQPPPEWLSGHCSDGSPSQKPHLAFFPLPHIGREHADGHSLGVAIAMPREVSAREQQRCLGKVLWDERGGARELVIRMGRIGVWKLLLDDGDDPRLSLQGDTWTADVHGAIRWATVTPIVFDRHPKRAGDGEETIAVACERIGLRKPADVVLGPVSIFAGVPHARRFPNMQRKSGGNLHHTHAVLTFERPIIGPMLIGAGRFRGYGLCRPVRERGDS